MLLKALTSWKSPAGPAGGLSTLIFHRVLPRVDPLFPGEPDAVMFDRILAWVGANYNVISLTQAVDGLARGSLPARALTITFDDGYADNHDVALPILRKHQMSATFFIASGFIGGGRMWNDTVIESIRGFNDSRLDLTEIGLGVHSLNDTGERRAAIDGVLNQLKYKPFADRASLVADLAAISGVTLPDDLMMCPRKIRALHEAGMIIGGHTVSHPILARLSDGEALDEISAGKRALEAIIGRSIDFFAYPNGKPGRDYLAPHVSMVKRAGFTAAVSTAPGVARSGCDLFQIPRFTPWDRSRWRFHGRMLLNMITEVAVAPQAA